jgi:hypothetical protein
MGAVIAQMVLFTIEGFAAIILIQSGVHPSTGARKN